MTSVIRFLFLSIALHQTAPGEMAMWDPSMPGGLKVKINGEIFSFTTDLCSGGVFFKQPVKLDSLCIHGYFFRRPNGCRMSESDIISGENYVCTNYNADSSQEVQAFIPVTPPELPLAHTIAFFDDGDTLHDLRRYAYVKALQRRFYAEVESGSPGVVISNSHHTRPVNIGKICYSGKPGTNGAAYLFNLTQDFSGRESYGFFTGQCKPGSISIPWRRAVHYSFTEGYSEPAQFSSERWAKLPLLFPEIEETTDEPSSEESDEEDIPVLDFIDAHPPDGEGRTEDPGSDTAEVETGVPASILTLGVQDENNVDGPQLPGGFSSLPLLDYSDGLQHPENSANDYTTLANNDSGTSNAANNSLSGANNSDGNGSLHLDNDLLPLLDYSDGFLHNSDDNNGTTTKKPFSFVNDYVSEILRHSPMKLKKYPIINPLLTNWNSYVEEAVVLSKFKILIDLEYTGNFDFETGRVNDKISMGSHADTMWYKIIQSAAQVVKELTPKELIAPGFFDDVVQLFGYLFRNLPDDLSEMNEPTLQIITEALLKCRGNAKKISAIGVGCPLIFKHLEVENEDGTKKYLNLERLPPSGNSFHTHTNDVVVESAWNFIDIALCHCYPHFTPDGVNEHHRLFVYMKNLFRNERIQKRWFSALKGVDTYAGLLPYGNYKVIMYNYDKLKAAVHNSCYYPDWISKPELVVPTYSGTNVVVQSKRYSQHGESSKRKHWVNSELKVYDGMRSNEDTFIFGDEGLKYERPFQSSRNKGFGIPWRIRRRRDVDEAGGNNVEKPKNPIVVNFPDQKQTKGSETTKPQDHISSSSQPSVENGLDPFKIYEIWNGMAYCLQANYNEDANGKMFMRGIKPSLKDLSSFCQNSDNDAFN